MELNENHYKVYGEHNTNLESGERVKLDLWLTLDKYGTKELLEELITQNKDLTINSSKNLREEETKEFSTLKSKAYDLLKTMAELQLHDRAITYNNKCKEIEELETTNNEWVLENKYIVTTWNISNKVYAFSISLLKHDFSNEVFWTTPYYFVLRTVAALGGINDRLIKRVEPKFYSEEDALKYIDGRKKFYAKYFKELYPVVPKEYVRYFNMYGILLKPYKLEE